MKRFLRISFLALLVLAGAGMLTWYFIMRRSVPQQAKHVPKNAVAVFTANVRELALDYSGDHLFPDLGEGKMPSAIKALLKSIEKNGGSGLAERSDLLAFVYRVNDEAYIGICAEMDDSSKFRKLVKDGLAENYPLSPEKIYGGSLMRFDSIPAVIAWNEDCALFISILSNHDKERGVRQCERLLALKPEESIAGNASFCAHEHASFDMGLWVQRKELIEFTGGGYMLPGITADAEFISFTADFTDGVTNIRQQIEYTPGHSAMQDYPAAEICCDAKEVKGFYHFLIDPRSDSLASSYSSWPPLAQLPLSNEEFATLLPALDGNCSYLLHDTLSFDSEFITYSYDEEFNQVAVKSTERKTESAASICLGLSDPAKARKLIGEWMQQDSIPEKNGSWYYSQSGLPMRMMISGKTLVLSSCPRCDGNIRKIPAQWEGFDLYLPAGDYMRRNESGLVRFVFAGFEGIYELLGEHLDTITVSTPTEAGNTRQTIIRMHMKTDHVNALIQLSDIFRKGLRN